MKLSRLLEHVDGGVFGESFADGYDPDITALHYRSQEVEPGGMFVAIQGTAADGHDYIDDALSRGAAAVLAQRRVGKGRRIFRVQNSRMALAQAAAAFYGNPSESLTLIGVTGTNGKTTVTYLLESMLAAAGYAVGVIGTVNVRFAGRVLEAPVTTPESLDLQRILARMKTEGITHVVMEVSSHGIDLGRTECCRFDMGAFTNLTQDHLDYHGTVQAYWACKQRFFTRQLISGPKGKRAVAVVNTDSSHGRELYEKLSAFRPIPSVVTYGNGQENSVYPVKADLDLSGIRGTVVTPEGPVAVSSRLVGTYNLENILCAVAVGMALKLSQDAMQEGLERQVGIPGRLERVDDDEGRMVFVDYAHTPDALRNVLETLKGLSRGRLIGVFGCGGDRDTGKRPQMGKIAAGLCDLAVVTSDNPRTEEPARIIDDILAGVRREMSREFRWEDGAAWTGERGYRVTTDRARAIHEAVQAAKSGDVVLIAGKGHETYQIVGTEKRMFDDRATAARALQDTVKTGVIGMEKGAAKNSGIRWTGADILAATGGQVVCGDLSGEFATVGIDSRVLGNAPFFIAIVGKNHDGHRFCSDVVESGGRGLLVNSNAAAALPIDDWRGRSVLCIAVDDTTRALGDMAAYHRKRQPALATAITGSCGKTTTRDMAAAVLRQRFHTLSSRKNFNNEIGLPLTLLALDAAHEWVVAELGMNRPGEIARLGEICRPDIGVITNIGPAHLEGLGSVDNVMAAKGELLPTIAPLGRAVLNADDPRGRLLAGKAAGRTVLFGESEDADVRGVGVAPCGVGSTFELVLPSGVIRIELSVPGRFMVSNALAAAAVGYLAGLGPEQIKDGLEGFRPVTGRMNLVETISGIHILDDSYNANPASMTAALETLKALKGRDRGIAVLGDMLELGIGSEDYHRELGALVAASGADRLYATGTFSEAMAAGAGSAQKKTEVVVSGSPADILGDLKDRLSPGDWVLVKGSRGSGMETIVSALVQWAGGEKAEG